MHVLESSIIFSNFYVCRWCVQLLLNAICSLGSYPGSLHVLECGFPVQFQAAQNLWEDSLCPHHQHCTSCSHSAACCTHSPERGNFIHNQHGDSLFGAQYGLHFLLICSACQHHFGICDVYASSDDVVLI